MKSWNKTDAMQAMSVLYVTQLEAKPQHYNVSREGEVSEYPAPPWFAEALVTRYAAH